MQQSLMVPVNERRDHIRGHLDAPVTLLEYGDFECPDCGAAHEVITRLRAVLGHDLRFVYRHFPLTETHFHAALAAEAAEAAGSQHKFWMMHDLLFANQHALEERHLAAYAGAIGLELSPFLDSLDLHIHASRVREDSLSGARSGVSSTPAFFVNEVRYEGPHDFDSLLDAIEVVGSMKR